MVKNMTSKTPARRSKFSLKIYQDIHTLERSTQCVRHGPHARQARWLHGFRPGVDPGSRYGDF